MKKHIILSFTLISGFFAGLSAQQDSLFENGFETAIADSGTVLNGSDGGSSFFYGNWKFPVSWDTTYKYWSGGWAVSAKIDGSDGPSSSSRYLYTARPGWGAEGRSKGRVFKVGQNGSSFSRSGSGGPDEWPLIGFYIANSNYTYNSMKKGDMFAKKFGGSTGKDADSLLLVVKGWSGGMLKDSVKIYLGDYRSEDSTRDYLLDTWTYVNFRKFGNLDSFSFDMFSSDNSAWGMNTPAFFCLDRLQFMVTLDVKADNDLPAIHAFPVPAGSLLHVTGVAAYHSVLLRDMTGRQISAITNAGQDCTLDVSGIPAGQYQLQAIGDRKMLSRNIMIVH